MRILPIVLLIGFTQLQISGAAGQDRSKDRAEIEANEHAWTESFVTGDPSAAIRFMADDFSGIGTDGKPYTKKDEIASIQGQAHSTKAAILSLNVAFFGEVAVAHVRERDTGPAPELRPMNNTTTDIWARRNGRWLVVAAMDMDLGFDDLPQFAGDAEQIRQQREANNKALAAHDLDGFAGLFDEHALFVWSDGSTAIGRDGLKKDFAERFKDPSLTTYIRSPHEILVAEDGARAVERGRWTGLLKNKVVGGDYAAHWERTSEGWRVRGELYVRLYCTGAGCAQ
jgi:uncharacterized protein (TIGR02246 family)